mgnify:CR=1 FL=1
MENKMKLTHFLGDVLLLAVTVGCTGGKTGTEDEETDSLSADTVPTEEPLRYLPDTAYASAEAVTFTVEDEDSVEHPLRDFDDRYAASDNVCVFRKNLLRDGHFGGRVKGTPSEIEVDWIFQTAYDTTRTRFGTWGGGTGWTGQPIYVHWTPADTTAFRQSSPGLTDDFSDEEVMVGSLCGKAYFLNFHTGRASRTHIDLRNVVKGSMSLDPEYKNLYFGQGVPRHEPGTFGHGAIDLLRHEITFFFGPDPRAWRGWNAFDSNAIVAGGYLFWCGENGGLYKYERSQGSLRRISVLRYRFGGAMAPGIESSLCVYRNYGFFSDNQGNIVCVNLNNMHPVWHVKNLDDSDGTIVCRVEQGTPYLYTACEVDKQGTQGKCRFLKLRALDGTTVWERLIDCNRVDLGAKVLDGGMYSTPLLGQGDCDSIIFANICRNSAHPDRGQLTAIRTTDGSIKYTVGYGNFCWSSPVGLTNDDQQFFIFTADANGVVYLVRGIDGQVLCRKAMGANFESSPCVVGNSIVVGCRGTKIYKFRIKNRETP